jgi:fluoroquinolone transport system permease protein
VTTLAIYRTLGAIDLRGVARDSLLRWMVLLAPLLGLLLRYGVPPIAAALHARFGFDLTAYYGLIMSFLPIGVAAMIGTVIGFLLLDQRDDGTMTALLVTPVTLSVYLRYRLSVLMLACVALSCVAFRLANLVDMSMVQVFVTSAAAAPLAPIYALFLGTVASNKVQGFALVKALGIVVVPCVAAYFVTPPWQNVFGFIPHYWPLKVFWLFDDARLGQAVAYALTGCATQALVIALLARRFAVIVRS